MRIIQVSEGQTLTDIVMQYCGNSSRLFEICVLNNDLSPTLQLLIGSKIMVPDTFIEDTKIFEEFNTLGLVPASLTDDGLPLGGIGYMAIGQDFIVS